MSLRHGRDSRSQLCCGICFVPFGDYFGYVALPSVPSLSTEGALLNEEHEYRMEIGCILNPQLEHRACTELGQAELLRRKGHS